MTQDELDRIEARVQAWRTAHQIDAVECMAASADDVPALVAEVKRLRGLVEAAYHEGCREGSTTPEYWEQTETFKALEGA